MNKTLTILLASLLFFFNCQKEDSFQGETTNFGVVEYYQPFLFCKCDTITLSKSLRFNFNDYSLEKSSSATIKFVGEFQKEIRDKSLQLYINDNKVIDNTFTINSKNAKTGTLKLGLKLLPNYPEGYTSGFISVAQHSLDLINNNDLNTSNETRIFKWEAEHKLIMNPLKKALIIVFTFISSALIIWFLFLRNKIYPKFKKGRIQILSPYFGSVLLNRNIKLIILTSSPKKQKYFNKVFTGKIQYEINPIYDKDIILRPGRGKKIKIKLPLGTQISPPSINLEPYNSYKVKTEKHIIEIQYS
ncbi:hypothetical protein [Mangrovimonas cancribranchiae]|uniref:Uncharacterized protein n=1 Tax=Mangrovimonas cancribranchiae TaxID=3080055 RepID=A0AAU6PAW3_9FLAO